MNDITVEFGRSAGKVWEVLRGSGPQSWSTLLKNTKLDGKTLHAAIGWLARENKICRNNSMYELGVTNLTEQIGGDAGKIWSVLEMWGDVDVSNLARLAQIDQMDVFSALGWLARENKIEQMKGALRDDVIRFKLKHYL